MKVKKGIPVQCAICGHWWVPRKDDIRRCPNPKCQSVYFDTPKKPEQEGTENEVVPPVR